MADAIIVRDLSKRYRHYHLDRPRTIQDAVVRGLKHIAPEDYFWALRHISFHLPRGRTLGFVGPNGAGKSTLLRLIGGVGRAEEGSVEVRGRISALFDLGAGFHPDLTGRENIYMNGMIGGLTRREVQQKFDSIVAFSELGQFIDSPLRTYSTGMQVRLGFAVAAAVEPEIMLIDEVLAVGDVAFQTKCLERIAQFKKMGTTLILISHNEAQIRQFCDEVLWLREGQIFAHGNVQAVLDRYLEDMQTETRRRTPYEWSSVTTPGGIELKLNVNRFGSMELEITAVRLLHSDRTPIRELQTGDQLLIEIEYKSPTPIEAPVFGVTLTRQEDGFICYDTSTSAMGLALPTVQGSGQVNLWLDRLDLSGGAYYVHVGAYANNWGYAYDYHWQAYLLIVSSSSQNRGILNPPQRWEYKNGTKYPTTAQTLDVAKSR